MPKREWTKISGSKILLPTYLLAMNNERCSTTHEPERHGVLRSQHMFLESMRVGRLVIKVRNRQRAKEQERAREQNKELWRARERERERER